MFRWLFLFLLIVALLISSLWYSQLSKQGIHVSGFIESDEIRLGSRLGGRVAKVNVDEGQTVAAGDLLIELEPFDLMQRRAEAEALWNQRTAIHEKLVEGYRKEEIAQAVARLEQVQANLLQLKNGPRPQEIKSAEAELALAQAELELAEMNLARVTSLQKQGAATQEILDTSVKERKVASDRVVAKQQQLNVLKEGTRQEEIAAATAKVEEMEQAVDLMKDGYRDQEIAEAYSAMKAAESALAAIDAQLEELKVRAPTKGVVEAIELRPGDLIAPNAPVMSMIDSQRLWVRAYVPEDALDIKLGEKVPLTVDSFPDKIFQGEITFVARQAEFTPGNVQTPEDRSKQVFRIKVTLIEGHDVLRPGMAADVWLDEKP